MIMFRSKSHDCVVNCDDGGSTSSTMVSGTSPRVFTIFGILFVVFVTLIVQHPFAPLRFDKHYCKQKISQNLLSRNLRMISILTK